MLSTLRKFLKKNLKSPEVGADARSGLVKEQVVDTNGSNEQNEIGAPAMGTVDIESVAFAKRLANLMVATRRQRRLSVRAMAKRSGGRFTSTDLKACEAGVRPLDEPTVLQLTGLYGCDVKAILPSRLPIVVELGRISAGGVSAPYEPLSSTSLLEAYLRLVRSLRRQKSAPTVELRRDDIEILAHHLQEAGEVVVERLGALMGATRSQRTAMAGLFATGAVVIGLVGTAAAGGNAGPGSGTPTPGTRAPSPAASTTSTLPPLVESQVTSSTTAPIVVAVGDDLPVPAPAPPAPDAPQATATADTAVSAAIADEAVEPPVVLMPDTDPVDADLVDIDLVDSDLVDAEEPVVDSGTPPVPVG
jgi:hypothetical protein